MPRWDFERRGRAGRGETMVLRPSVCAECAFLTSEGFCEKFGCGVLGRRLYELGECAGYWPRSEDYQLLRGFAGEAAAEEESEEGIAGEER
jgi:hypothetical protein